MSSLTQVSMHGLGFRHSTSKRLSSWQSTRLHVPDVWIVWQPEPNCCAQSWTLEGTLRFWQSLTRGLPSEVWQTGALTAGQAERGGEEAAGGRALPEKLKEAEGRKEAEGEGAEGGEGGGWWGEGGGAGGDEGGEAGWGGAEGGEGGEA